MAQPVLSGEANDTERDLVVPARPKPDKPTHNVRSILEALLAKKNLVRDEFLAGNMNPQMFIPVEILVQHEQLKALGATADQVVEAAKASARMTTDDAGQMVRPLLRSKRNVIILRDIPDGTTVEEIRELFQGAPHGDNIREIKPEVNNTWFVKLSLDEGTQDVALWLRSKNFKGKLVNAAMKSEHFLRSFYTAPEMGSPFPGAPGAMPGMDVSMQFCGKGGFLPGGEGGDFAPPWLPHVAMTSGKGKHHGPPTASWMQDVWQEPGFWKPWGRRHQAPPLVFASSAAVSPQAAAPPASWGGKAKSRSKGRGKWSERTAPRPRAANRQGPDTEGAVGPDEEGRPRAQDGTGDALEISSGHCVNVAFLEAVYKHDFRKYSPAEVQAICEKLAGESLTRPTEFESLAERVSVFLDVPVVEM
uniref:HTH La-type RNA-binding domain-containing protein n=1 Tax=Noctiluca scintillans TaxID=2966 RepID=A0A7S1FJZ4_NOCSC